MAVELPRQPGMRETRYTHLLDALGIAPDASEQLREAARRVDDVRFAAQAADESGAADPLG